MNDQLPETIPVAKLRKAFELLGLPFDNTLSVHISPRTVAIERARQDERGSWLVAGDEIATVTTTIGIDRERP